MSISYEGAAEVSFMKRRVDEVRRLELRSFEAGSVQPGLLEVRGDESCRLEVSTLRPNAMQARLQEICPL